MLQPKERRNSDALRRVTARMVIRFAEDHPVMVDRVVILIANDLIEGI
jgi:hypothetical protein